MAWTTLKRGNDWGHEYLAPEPLDERGYASANRGLKFENGQTVRVRFPDGTEASLPVRLRHTSTTVGDMGHTYPVEFDLPYIAVTTHGVVTELTLDAPGLQVWVSDQVERVGAPGASCEG
jgi:hypothetical protein